MPFSRLLSKCITYFGTSSARVFYSLCDVRGDELLLKIVGHPGLDSRTNPIPDWQRGKNPTPISDKKGSSIIVSGWHVPMRPMYGSHWACALRRECACNLWVRLGGALAERICNIVNLTPSTLITHHLELPCGNYRYILVGPTGRYQLLVLRISSRSRQSVHRVKPDEQFQN